MSKLPAEFVKAPTPSKQAKPRAPRTRKASLISPEAVADPRVLSLALTDEEFAALEEARQKLAEAGSSITLEQMIHRVFAEWMLRARGVVQAPPAAATDTKPSGNATTPRDEHVVARLRAFVAAPLRMWPQLARHAWRNAIARLG